MQPHPWEQDDAIPSYAATLLAALRFPDGREAPHGCLLDLDWQRALRFCDRAQLTLLIAERLRGRLPESVQQRMDRNLAANRERNLRLLAALAEIDENLTPAGAEYVLLKGFAHGTEYAPCEYVRVQYDLDLFAPRASLAPARDAILALGYESLAEFNGFPTDHLPAMVRKTGWQWRGDFFDPDIPPSIDLHFRFWDAGTERLELPGLDQFWERRSIKVIGDRPIPVLHPLDELGYTALHLLRHLLRGSLRVYHVYELAYFLDRRAGDAAFWERWRAAHPERLRRAEAISFLLARKWFGCELAEGLAPELESLGDSITGWMDHCCSAPVEGMFTPNKAEIWLHLSLVESRRDRIGVVRRRLVPLRPPGPVDSVFVPDNRLTPWLRVRKRLKYAAHIAERAIHHARAFPGVAAQGVTWALRRRGIEEGFLPFLLAANLFNLGIFIFYVLYNLFLLDLGYREDFLGLVAGAMTAGTIAGSLPAAAAIRRTGLKPALLAACAATALLTAARALVPGKIGLGAAAFLAGAAFSLWVVASAPAVARLTGERRRPLGFSLWLGTGIATGILGGLLGGWLPRWLAQASIAANPHEAKRMALLAGCAFALAAVLPLKRVRFPKMPPPERKILPSGVFIRRYLLVLGVWQFSIGALNPLFNAYFAARLHASAEQIGAIFAGSQFAQAAAVLSAPWVFRKLGIAGGISSMQLATALMLAALAWTNPGIAGGFLYAAYMSFQVSTEPGLFSILMNRVKAAEQGGASALNFLVMSSAQAVAAVAAGVTIARTGYGPVLTAAAVLAACAALMAYRVFSSTRS